MQPMIHLQGISKIYTHRKEVAASLAPDQFNCAKR